MDQNDQTTLQVAGAHEAEANFIAAKSSSLLSKWYGESERQISKVFKPVCSPTATRRSPPKWRRTTARSPRS